jgi:hypothetical protein
MAQRQLSQACEHLQVDFGHRRQQRAVPPAADRWRRKIVVHRIPPESGE